MSHYTFERLSAADHSFLVAEREGAPMHVAAMQIFEAGPLRTVERGIDLPAIRRATEGVLHLIPRYRQRLAWVPFERKPVWVDDADFRIEDHLRHAALPRPGGLDQLKTLASWILAQPLDRHRPLWENWVIEGLEGGDRFAIITKIHHCMVDGIAGMDLAQILLSPAADWRPGEPEPYMPRPRPSSVDLLTDAAGRWLSLPINAMRGLGSFALETGNMGAELMTHARALANLAGWAVSGASASPLNGPLSRHRNFDWTNLSFTEARRIAQTQGCTLNDVVLATVAGAVRDFLIYRRVDPSTIDFRVATPVNARRPGEDAGYGNHLSSWVLRLPVDEPDALQRLARCHLTTSALKASRQALGVEAVFAAAEWTPSFVLSLATRAVSGPINAVVTNVPGPPIPLYLLGSRLLEVYPLVPLLESLGLGIAIISYAGRLCFGFNADADLLPDVDVFARMVQHSFQSLSKATGGETRAPALQRVKAAAAGASLTEAPTALVAAARD